MADDISKQKVSLEAEKAIGVSLVTGYFQLIYILVKDNNLSLFIQFVLVLAQTIQIQYFKFSDQLLHVWQSSVADEVQGILGYFNFSGSYRHFDYIIFQMIFYVQFGITASWIFFQMIALLIILNQKPPGQMLLSLLRTLNNVIPTILYVPFFHTNTIMLDCNDDQVLSWYKNQTCWQGIIIINEVLAVVGIILLYANQTLYAYIYFDSMYDEKKSSSKRNGRCVLLYWTHVSLTMIFTILLPDNFSSKIFQIIQQVLGSAVCFIYMKDNDAFNNRIMQKIWLCAVSLDLWSSIMLAIAMLTENRIMIGSVITWLLCIPMIFAIQILSKQKREQSVIVNLNKFDDAIQLVDHVNEVLKLVDQDKKKLPQGLMLNGYIEFHNQTCANPHCPLKKVKFSLNLFKNRNDSVAKTDKRHALVYDTMSRLYNLGISKFPEDIYLRIAYSMFTLRVLKSKQQALDELGEIDKFKPTWDIQYVVFYIRRVIEAEISELSGEGQDFTEQKDFETKLNEFKSAMERSVALLMEFWSQFSDEKPDILKLYDIGSKLFPIRMYVDQMWKRLARSQNQQLPKALRLYSKYLIDIFNDRLQGIEMLEKARKIENQFSQRKAFKLGLSSNLNIDGQEDGCIFISLEEERFGMVYALNMSAASLFGFDKAELVNKKINNVMPSLYGVHHDDFLKRFLDTNESTLLNKERILFGKHKNGYIFPFIALLRPVYHVLKDGVEFVATIKKEKKIKDVAYMVCNKELILEDISTSCINLLGLDLKALQMKPIKLTDLFGDIEDLEQRKGGKVIEYTLPKITDEGVVFQRNDKSITLQISLIQINFLIMKTSESDQGFAGFQVKVERYVDHSNNISMTYKMNQEIKIQHPKKKFAFQFKPSFQIGKKEVIYLGESTDVLNNSEVITNLVDNSIHDGPLAMPFQKSEYVDPTQRQDSEGKIEYADGIRTIRLFEGQLLDIDKFGSDEEEEEELAASIENKANLDKQADNGESEEEYQTEGVFRSSKELQTALNTQSESKAVKCLWYLSVILYLILVLLCAVNNQLERNEIYGQIDVWQLMINEGQLLNELNIITGYSRELLLLKLGVHDISISNYENPITNRSQILNEGRLLKKALGDSILVFGNLSQSIFNSYAVYANVEMYMDYHTQTISVMDYASQQIVSKAISIANKNISELQLDDLDYFFVMTNSLNDFQVQLMIVYNQNVESASIKMAELSKSTLVILIVSASIMLFGSFILTLFLNKTLNTRQEILKIFLDIPERTAKVFYQKCENFLQQISSNDDEEIVSEVEQFMDERGGQEESVSLLGRKKKRFKNNEHKNFGFFLRMIFVAAVIESYFILVYFLDDNNLQMKSNIINEFNQTALGSGFYGLVVNAEKQFIINNTSPLLGKTHSKEMLQTLYDQMYYLDTLQQMYHSIDILFNMQEYKDFFNRVMFEDVCSVLSELKDIDSVQCQGFGDGIMKNGLMQSIGRHFQNIRHLQNYYDQIEKDPNQTFPALDDGFQTKRFTSNSTLDQYLNILRLPSSIEIDEMMNVYMKLSFIVLLDKYLHVLTINQESFIVQQLIIMILFLITLGLSLLVCWNPFLNKLNKEIWSTKCLLTFIPLDEIAKIRTISNYIRTVILEHNI